jgi:hypothetical protein
MGKLNAKGIQQYRRQVVIRQISSMDMCNKEQEQRGDKDQELGQSLARR